MLGSRHRAKIQILLIWPQTQSSYPSLHHKRKPLRSNRKITQLDGLGHKCFPRIITFTPYPPPQQKLKDTKRKSLLRQSHAYLNPVRPHKLPVRVLVGDPFLPQGHAVAPVERANVVLDRLCHSLPVMLNCTRKTDTVLSFSIA